MDDLLAGVGGASGEDGTGGSVGAGCDADTENDPFNCGAVHPLAPTPVSESAKQRAPGERKGDALRCTVRGGNKGTRKCVADLDLLMARVLCFPGSVKAVALGVAVGAWLCSACSDGGSSRSGTEESTTGGGATTDGSPATSDGTTGSSSGTTGGEAEAPIARGAFSIQILSPEGCSVQEQFVDLPALDSGRPVTATDKVSLAEDMGTGSDAVVLCTIAEQANGVFVSTSVDLATEDGDRSGATWGTIIADDVDTAGFVVASPELAGFEAEAGCSYSLIEFDQAAGSIWGSFSCESITPQYDDGEPCAVGTSYFALENCVTD